MNKTVNINLAGIVFHIDEDAFEIFKNYLNALKDHFKNEESFDRSFEKLDKSKPVYLYCRSGNRSKKSDDILIELGFSKVYDLKGGFIEWNLNEFK